MYVSVFPENGKTYCIISWLKSNDRLFSSIGEKLYSLNIELRKNYINNLLPIITENIAINPEAWDRMSKPEYDLFDL